MKILPGNKIQIGDVVIRCNTKENLEQFKAALAGVTEVTKADSSVWFDVDHPDERLVGPFPGWWA